MMRFAWIAGVMLAATAVVPASADVIYPRGLVKAPETLDPQKAATFNETPILYDLFEGLVTLDGDGRIVPGAAESWSLSPDGLVYTFQLRDGARWSNGAIVKSNDFVASFRRLFAPETGATETGPLLVIRNASAIQQGSAKADTLGVAAPDAKTLEISLDRPVPTFLGRLALPVALPVHVASIKKLGADFGTTGNIVSNGAYRLAAVDKKDGYILVKNPRFRDAKTLPIDSVVYKTFEDVAGCVDAYRAKAVLSCPDVPAEILPALREEFGSALKLAPYPGTYYFAINTAKPPFDKVEVRRALSLAIDREALARAAWSGAMIPTETLVPPELSGTAAAPVAPIEARRAEARKLLAKAGFQQAKLAAPMPEPVKAADETTTATGSQPADGPVAAKPDVGKDVTNSITAKSRVTQPGDVQPVAPATDDASAKPKPAEPTPAGEASTAEEAKATEAKAAEAKAAEAKAAEAKKPAVASGPQPLRLTIRVGTGLGHEETARILAEQWQGIGVEATIVTEANPEHFARLRDGGDFDVARTGWIADEVDPIDLLTVLRSDNVRFNYPRYRNRDYDALLDKAAVDMDGERRKQQLAAAAALLAADAPILPVLGYVSLSLVAPTLSGWNANPYNVHPTRFLAIN